MESSQEKQKQQWLAAVAGRPDPEADSVLNLQAEAVRRVLTQHKAVLETKIPPLDERVYENILAQGRKQEEAAALRETRPSNHMGNIFSLFCINAAKAKYRTKIWAQSSMWGLAATLVLGVLVVLQTGVLTSPPEDESTVYRGSTANLVQVVDDPVQRLDELLKDFGAMGISNQVSVQREPQKITIEVPNTEQVMTYLEDQRFRPDPSQQPIVIILKPSKH